MLVRPVGTHALLLDLAPSPAPAEAVDDPLAWHAELVRRRDAGQFTAVDIVPGATTVLVDGVPEPEALAALLPSWTPADPGLTHARRVVEVPVRYTGEDLPDVARLWGCSVAAAVDRLAGTELTVAFCGFAPGFAYLRGLPGRVPRLATPRPRVPAGSVGLADGYAGIYPTASPGGWRLVGHTDVRLFDPDADQPALLQPGTLVRLAVAP